MRAPARYPRVMRAPAAIIACLLLCLPASAAAATGPAGAATRAASAHTSTLGPEAGTHSTATQSESPIPVPPSSVPPKGRRLSANQVLAIAAALPKMKAVRRANPGSYGGAYLKGPTRWQVSYFSRSKKEIGQVIIEDRDGAVAEQWTGFQVAWTMARGYPGAFGRHVNALYVWLPLCALFLLPFANFRRPLSLLNLDLLMLLSFSVSLAFFDHAHIYASVPLSYPPMLYLLARMLAMLRRRRAGTPAPAPLKLLIPMPWLAVGLVFLLSFRVALNMTDGNVIDVGYAGVIGAKKVVDGQAAVRLLPVGQRTRRHLRPVQLRGLHAVRGDLRLERHLG